MRQTFGERRRSRGLPNRVCSAADLFGDCLCINPFEVKPANSFLVRPSEFSVVLLRVFKALSAVPFEGCPFEIGNNVVRWVAIFMRSEIPIWPWTDKRLKNQPVGPSPELHAVDAEKHAMVARQVVLVLLHDFRPSGRSLTASEALHLPKIRDLIQTFRASNRFPDFFQTLVLQLFHMEQFV